MDPVHTYRSAPLIAEDLMLLLTDDATGRTTASDAARPLFGGALLVELAIEGTAIVDHNSGQGLFSTTRILAVERTGAGESDPLLAQAWTTVAQKPRSAQDLVGRLGKGTKEAVAQRLVERGILERREGRILGLFPTTTWPARDVAHERAVRERLHACLVVGATPDPRTAALVGLLHAVNQTHRVLDTGLPTAEVKRRAAAITQGGWATDAVKQAVAAAQVATMTAITAATSAAAVSS